MITMEEKVCGWDAHGSGNPDVNVEKPGGLPGEEKSNEERDCTNLNFQ
jgi:hypothetical protein